MTATVITLPSRRLSRPRPRLMERYRQKMFRETTEALKGYRDFMKLSQELVEELEAALSTEFPRKP